MCDLPPLEDEHTSGQAPSDSNSETTVSPKDHTDDPSAWSTQGPPPPTPKGLDDRTPWYTKNRPKPSRNEIPQLSNMWTLFNEAQPVQMDTIREGFMLCDVRLAKRDWWDDADLQLKVTLGKGRTMSLRGEEDSQATIVGMPVAHLTKGDTIQITLTDRDVLVDDHIDTATTTYPGSFPLLWSTQNAKARLSCQLIPPSTVQTTVQPLLQTLEHDHTHLLTKEPDPTRSDWGCGPSFVQAYEGHILVAVAWLGWTHPKIKDHRQQFTQARTQFTTACKASVAHTYQQLPPVGQPVDVGSGWNVSAGSVVCGDAAWTLQQSLDNNAKIPPPIYPCLMELEVTHHDSTPHTLSQPTHGRPAFVLPPRVKVQWVDDQGQPKPMVAVAFRHAATAELQPTLTHNPGDSGTILLGLHTASQPPKTALLQFETPSGALHRARLP
ncbi:MAG: hypothetical protein AAFX99_08180 [Myxococcota bacterium]